MRVLVSGAFDLFHIGHLHYLEQAKKYGDYLIVNLIPDNRVKEKKGEGRPIFPLEERKEIIKALKCVDEIVSISAVSSQSQSEYEKSVIKIVKPDMFIRAKFDSEIAQFCETRGMLFVIAPETSPKHTTDIIKQIKNE